MWEGKDGKGELDWVVGRWMTPGLSWMGVVGLGGAVMLGDARVGIGWLETMVGEHGAWVGCGCGCGAEKLVLDGFADPFWRFCRLPPHQQWPPQKLPRARLPRRVRFIIVFIYYFRLIGCTRGIRDLGEGEPGEDGEKGGAPGSTCAPLAQDAILCFVPSPQDSATCA